ncbi:hypothetical protein [Thermogymnomonas acidicola]|uniref:hypothetical protein n=1 Tax=Thermogymnomonas acidicola TaxID=399579 RepID=UPI000946753A|nr:hypothetical protein [Thermogymnomonas acidicola]
MLVRDIDRALDVRVVVRVKQDTELMRMAAELRMKLPVFIYSRSGQLWMSTYVRKQDLDSRLSMALRRMDCRETRDAYVVDERINNVEQMSVVQKLLEVPSFAMNRSDSMNGYVNIYARFHHSHINLVSEELVKFAGEDKVVLDWLGGPSPGITRIMDRINQEYRVTLVSYRVPGGDELPVLTGNLGEVELLAETKSSVAMPMGSRLYSIPAGPFQAVRALRRSTAAPAFTTPTSGTGSWRK